MKIFYIELLSYEIFLIRKFPGLRYTPQTWTGMCYIEYYSPHMLGIIYYNHYQLFINYDHIIT